MSETDRVPSDDATTHRPRWVPRSTTATPGPWMAMWSRTEPLTLFGAVKSGRDWDEIAPIFQELGQQFSNCLSHKTEIVAAEARGDLAYIVALERTTASINGAEPTPYVLRVTTIFRRENGEWKAVHRHGDALAAGIRHRQRSSASKPLMAAIRDRSDWSSSSRALNVLERRTSALPTDGRTRR